MGNRKGAKKTTGLEEEKTPEPEEEEEEEEAIPNEAKEETETPPNKEHEKSESVASRPREEVPEAESPSVASRPVQQVAEAESQGTPIKKRAKLSFSSPIGGMLSRQRENIKRNMVFLHYEQHKCGAFRAWLQKNMVVEEPYWHPTKLKLTNGETGQANREVYKVFELFARRCPVTGQARPSAPAGRSASYTWTQMLYYPSDNTTVVDWANHLRNKINEDMVNPNGGYGFNQTLAIGTNFTNTQSMTTVQTAMLDKHVVQLMRSWFSNDDNNIISLEDLLTVSDDDFQNYFTTAASGRQAVQACIHENQW